jgi:hypothetical protein
LGAGGGSPDVIRHLVRLGDALQNIDLGEGNPGLARTRVYF